MNEQQARRFMESVMDRGFRGCPGCGNTNFSVGKHYLRVPVSEEMTGTLRVIEGSIPLGTLVPLVCRNCSFTSLFDPEALGLEGN